MLRVRAMSRPRTPGTSYTWCCEAAAGSSTGIAAIRSPSATSCSSQLGYLIALKTSQTILAPGLSSMVPKVGSILARHTGQVKGRSRKKRDFRGDGLSTQDAWYSRDGPPPPGREFQDPLRLPQLSHRRPRAAPQSRRELGHPERYSPQLVERE